MKKTRAKKFKVRMFYHLQNLFWGFLSGGLCPGGFCPDTGGRFDPVSGKATFAAVTLRFSYSINCQKHQND